MGDYTVLGGYSDALGVSGNTLTVNSGLVGSAVAGYTQLADGVSSGNRLIVNSGVSVGGISVGGFVNGTGTVRDGGVAVNLGASPIVLGPIYGGIIAVSPPGVVESGGTLQNNSVTVSGNGDLTVNGAVIAASTNGRVPNGSSLTGNSVTVGAGTGTLRLHTDVTGAWITAQATGANQLHTISGNSVTLNRGHYGIDGGDNYVAGAWASFPSSPSWLPVANATFSGNTVTARGNVVIEGALLGAGIDSDAGPANVNTFTGNSVNYQGFTSCTAGVCPDYVAGAYGNSGTAASNSVTLVADGGDIEIQNYAAGALMLGDADAERNYVDISARGTYGVTVNAFVSGAHTDGGSAGKSVSFNEVRLSGKVRVGGDVFGGRIGSGSADGNTVFIDGLNSGGASVAGTVYGGFVNSFVTGSSADGNRVSLGNLALNQSVIGGNINGTGSGSAQRNTINLFGKITLAPGTVSLYGSDGSGVNPALGFVGNTLVLDHVDMQTPNNFFNVGRFQNIRIAVNSSVAKDPSKTLITATGYINLTNGTGSAMGTENSRIFIETTGVPLSLHDSVNVAAAPSVVIVGSGLKATGSTGLLDFEIPLTITTVAGIERLSGPVEALRPNAKARALSELPLADIAFVNRGSDYIAGRAIPAAIASTFENVGISVFATVGYGYSSTETGSHIEVKGFSGDVGIAVGTETSAGPFLAGAFLEFGDGTFESFNDFHGVSSVNGEGDLSYIGGGVFARFDLGRPDSSRPYFEASVRFGKTDADFRTRDFTGTDIDYDMDAKYWGFHAGGGYIIDFDGFDGSLDLSAKYFHTHRDGDDFTVLGQRVSVGSVTSSRVKAGARLNYDITPTIRSYFGLYYEHEFDGDSKVTYAGFELPKATLGGSTGIGELGLIVSVPGGPFEVQLGVEGSAGRRDSISGGISLRYTF
ncbi:MAG: hypothetical protein LBQ79_08345 [Deltaproteobacteria bacterium]|nr:hypothetical protein [Deltaproteobacteria bacterium]